MLYAVVSACLVVAGCGRFDFDELPPEHDEDGDGIPDVSDPCPHVAGGYADRDGDGVGDACDPNPDVPTESFRVFATLMPGDNPFTDAAAFEQQADAVHFSGDTAGMSLEGTLATARIDIGFDILALVGSGQHQVASGIISAVPTYYFVELNESGPLRDVGVISYDTTNGYQFLGQVDHPGMHPGSGVLRCDAVARAPQTFTVLAGWTDELYTATGPTPEYAGGTSIRFAVNGLDIAIRYVVVIETH
ncbi:MAG: hypothetical protein JWO36_5048 [Myxococcales bacterium]|nr:hypothetical protein [Myxococcales bacterium]